VTRSWEAQREETRKQVLQEHNAVYAAIVAGDPEAAREAARKHMEMSSSRIRNIDPAFVAQKSKKPARKRSTEAKK
jgi:DNA-binding FadR family transcriptional regulator